MSRIAWSLGMGEFLGSQGVSGPSWTMGEGLIQELGQGELTILSITYKKQENKAFWGC